MRLVLHIGMAKTGTSTLQSTLGQYARLLAKSGILYPTARTRPSSLTAHINHNVLSCSVKDSERVPRRFRFRGGSDPASIRAMGAEFWAAVRRDLDRKRPELVVLSGESLFYLRDGEIARLHALVTEVFDEIDIVAYVRDPASYYLSVMQQAVRGSHTVDAPCAFHVPLRSLLTRYLEAFDERVVVRAYDRSTLVNGCIVHDFLDTVLPGSAALRGQISVSDRNESLGAEAVWILRNLRRYGWPDDEDRLTPESTFVANTLRDLCESVPSTSLRLRPGIATAIRRAHGDDLEWLQDRFGVDLAGDGEPLDDEPEPPGWRSEELEEIVDVDRDRVERLTYELLKELASRSMSRWRLPQFMYEEPAARVWRPLRQLTRGRSGR